MSTKTDALFAPTSEVSRTIPFLRQRLLYTAIAFVVAVWLFAAYSLWQHGLTPPNVIVPLLSMAFAWFAYRWTAKPLLALARMSEVISLAKQGRLSARITGTKDN